MSNYFVKKVNDNDFRVVEKATELVIRKAKTHKEAHKLSGKLNGGNGFNGETPSFFIKKCEQLNA